MNKSISLVICNWNNLALLTKSLSFLNIASSLDIEIIIIDHNSDDPALWDYYTDLQKEHNCKIFSYKKKFNYSLMINTGVDLSSNDVVVMMNNDVEIKAPSNLLKLVRPLSCYSVGVVGSVLLYPDASIQHAGVALIDAGHADHIFRGTVKGTPNYDYIFSRPREYRAVTGALMACRRDVFDAVGGFNEVYLPVEYNDIDFCLKVKKLGFKIICLPLANIFHHESASRGKHLTEMDRLIRSEASRYMYEEWTEEYSNPDPHLNSHISYFS